MQQKQQELEQQQQQARAALQQAQVQFQEQQANENYQKELDRINKKEVALINALGRNEGATADLDNSGTADALEITKMEADQRQAFKDYDLKMQQIAAEKDKEAQKLQLEREKLQVERDNQANDLQIAKINAKNRGSKSSKK